MKSAEARSASDQRERDEVSEKAESRDYLNRVTAHLWEMSSGSRVVALDGGADVY